ncbi:hypothetical protein F4808DRAFT_455410 [Astrocystis sublimbata]|nr:hypothetical protein F4808DRAFT_455410 [Astrocystis sublimbata]
MLENTGVLICSVVGFPHGDSTMTTKALEAQMAVADGAREIDVQVNLGKVLSDDWAYVAGEIRFVNETVKQCGATLDVILEINFFRDLHIIILCRICSDIGVA